MLHKALLSALLASLIGSSLLTGCASPFERYYKPAVTAYGSPVTPPVTALLVRSRDPMLLWSRDPYGDSELLAQDGYVLIGTSSYDGAIDLSYAQDAAIQGKKVGAAVVLLKIDFTTASHYIGVGELTPEPWWCSPWSAWACFGPDNVTGPAFGPIGTTGAVFASYWAKANCSVRCARSPGRRTTANIGGSIMARDTVTPPRRLGGVMKDLSSELRGEPT
jgi:hypothetical protein